MNRSIFHRIEDRLWRGWPVGIRFSIYGLHGAVRVNDSALLERVAERLPPHSQPSQSNAPDFLYSVKTGTPKPEADSRYSWLCFGAQRLMRTPSEDLLLDEFESHLQFQVACNARERVLVHAGVVGWRGRAIILPGYSFAGKSTLVSELLKRGATYYSDEYAVLDEDGLVHPYARRLRLRSQTGEPLCRRTAADYGVATGAAPIPVGLVVLTKYRPNDRWRPRRLTAGQAVWELLNCTLTAERRPEASFHSLNRAIADAHCWKGFRGEANETAERLLEAVSGSSTR